MLVGFVALAACRPPEPPPIPPAERAKMNREALFAEIHPVKLSNCDFERIGDAHDGGYVICSNLLGSAQALYSYGISGADHWGCALSARLKLPVHQYDCFNVDRPPCEGASPVFHEECVGPSKKTEEGRLFDTIDAQVTRNGDAGKRLVMKIDVEGAEWPSFLATSDSLLQRIDQLSVEFHGVEEDGLAEVFRKLSRTFHVVNVHYNNWTCEPAVAPFKAKAFEVLFVNKNIAVVDPNAPMVSPNPHDAPNNWMRPDCQG
jgi:hypothetical protein